MPKKLTQKERLVDELMLAMLEWASKHPTRWHREDAGVATGRSALGEARRDRGLAEKNQYRLKPFTK